MMNSFTTALKSIILYSVFVLTFNSTLVAANLPPGFAEVLVAQNLDPTAMAFAPDGRLFITEKNGRVLIVENNLLLPDPFIVLEVDNYNERGLSGIAFHPEFGQNGYVYFYYTVKDQNHNRISRFTADGNYAVPGSERVLLDLNYLSGTIHNAGSMAFGPDGKLYVSVGDGANGGASQQLTTLLGKVLRLNDDGSAPADNPFYHQASGIYRSIYATGLRNSFSMAIQPGTGRIFATEVGAATWEEVNEILPAANYGWSVVEGPLSNQPPPQGYKDPVYAYSHAQGCAAVGAAFYNPETPNFPQQYIGKFFFADYCNGYIKYLDPDNPGVVTTFATGISRPLNLTVAPDGTMYYLARAGIGGGSEEDNTASVNGTLWQVIYTGSGKPFISVNPQSQLVPEGEDVSFLMKASGVLPIAYQWQRNDVDIPGANTPQLIWTDVMLSDSGHVFRCIVSNTQGADTTLPAILHVTTNHRPEPEILEPEEGVKYRAGDLLNFTGIALDFEQGELDASALRWKIDFHHNSHTHPALAPTAGILSGSYLVPQVGETSDNVWYRIHLTATDSSGLSRTVQRDILPAKTQFHVHSVPSGLPVYVESDYLQTPVSTTSVVGIARRIEVLPAVFAQDSILLFKEWSDGEQNVARTFAAQDDTITYTALYEKYPTGRGTGIRGYFYDSPPYDPTFYEPYKFTWIDTTIDFDWGGSSPAPTQLGNDFWLVRWEGFIEPLFDDIYDFHVIADDGIRLWVDNEQIIDAWVPQAPTEWIGTIELEGGKRYPLRLEFFEEAGGALCQLFWSSSRIQTAIVPKSQLYLEMATAVSNVSSIPVRAFPNPVTDFLIVEMESSGDAIEQYEIRNALGEIIRVHENDLISQTMTLDVRELNAGMYWLKGWTDSGQYVLFSFIKL